METDRERERERERESGEDEEDIFIDRPGVTAPSTHVVNHHHLRCACIRRDNRRSKENDSWTVR